MAAKIGENNYRTIDKAAWFAAGEALEKINEKKAAFIEEAARIIEQK